MRNGRQIKNYIYLKKKRKNCQHIFALPQNELGEHYGEGNWRGLLGCSSLGQLWGLKSALCRTPSPGPPRTLCSEDNCVLTVQRKERAQLFPSRVPCLITGPPGKAEVSLRLGALRLAVGLWVSHTPSTTGPVNIVRPLGWKLEENDALPWNLTVMDSLAAVSLLLLLLF